MLIVAPFCLSFMFFFVFLRRKERKPGTEHLGRFRARVFSGLRLVMEIK